MASDGGLALRPRVATPDGAKAMLLGDTLAPEPLRERLLEPFRCASHSTASSASCSSPPTEEDCASSCGGAALLLVLVLVEASCGGGTPEDAAKPAGARKADDERSRLAYAP